MAVVWSGRKEEPMFKTGSNVTNGPGDLGIYGILLAARRGRMVRLVQYQERAAPKRSKPVSQGTGICFVDKEAMRNQEPRVGAPRVYSKASLAADTFHVVFVENCKREPKAVF